MTDNPMNDLGEAGFPGHLVVKTGLGVGGDPNASSLEPGQKPKRTPEGAKLIAAMGGDAATVPSADWRTREVSAKPYPTAHGMKNPNASPAKIPSVTDRGGGQRAAFTNAMNRGRK
jgi:hypothetical protein